jgi:serine phosphatase RsbU (regulator of sigma subunit)
LRAPRVGLVTTTERYCGTGTDRPVIGVFEQWDACPARIHLSPGDLLAVFSDGVNEAAGDGVARVLDCVQQFSGDTQSDDLTVLVSKSIA